ncbi:hypothetical protein BP5796_05663 [Coleophoma crateriformis]|uniref:Tuberous sclerosis 1 n=1 Tax=Coleophoma crateriformis TaxID=565419 RepID=A0A3D8S3X1_9HELO|nr:hypothetical protein BP5796_05663 [Coleophoma crateriformis]
MSSGSLKDLTKALQSSIVNPTLPLPDDLVQVIDAYLDKHDSHDEADQQKLQEELLATYQKDVIDHPPRYAAFLAILRHLKRAIQGSGRLLQWWDRLAGPVLEQLGKEKGLPTEAHQTLLSILVYDEDDEELEDAKASCAILTENLLSSWLIKFVTATAGELDPEAQFVERKVKSILLEAGRKRPKDFLTVLNKFVVKKDSRIPALSLLVDFIEFQPPHLHQMLETPLFDNLLRCLQIDTSTRAISLAMTATIMFLPHVPSSLAKHLPSLFNIYSRMLFWDRYRRTGAEVLAPKEEKAEKTDDDTEDGTEQPTPEKKSDVEWEKLPYLLESDDEAVPELLHYFTFLYGLYPLNFMSYIRKPQRYLRHANFPWADELDVEPTEIRQRSETFRQLHLLHSNFFTMTIESELTDTNRWMKSQSADVVAECMALFSPGDGSAPDPPSRARNGEQLTKVRSNEDVPEQPLPDGEHMMPFPPRQPSWRNTTSTAVLLPNGARGFAGMYRRPSQTSFSLPSIPDSPSLRAKAQKDEEAIDSPTLAPLRGTPSPSQINIHSILDSQKTLRGEVQQTLASESAQSLASSTNNDDSNHADPCPQPLNSASVETSNGAATEAQMVIAYLHRELTLLKNDLSFERFLKQQHLSHIGQLRRQQIREARVEAETQNLINSNRALKSKLDEAKRSNLQMKRETEKSKSHSRKWEADLSAKLRVLKDEKKAWTSEGDQLKRDLTFAHTALFNMKQLIVNSESRELGSQQKLQSIESNMDELQRLRAEVDKLNLSVRQYEANESQTRRQKESAEAVQNEVELLKMKLASRDEELAKAKKAFEEELLASKSRVNDEAEAGRGQYASKMQLFLDEGLASSRSRIIELQKAHEHLLDRYTALQSSYLELMDSSSHDEPLLSGGISRARTDLGPLSRTSSPSGFNRLRQHTVSGTADYESSFASGSHFPVRPVRHTGETVASGSSDSRSLTSSHFQPFSPKSIKSNFAVEGDVGEDGKPKIKPQSDVRVFGRGGVQNIGKQPKKVDKKKEDGPSSKKGSGIRGIRGFG